MRVNAQEGISPADPHAKKMPMSSYIRCMLEEGISPADPHAKKMPMSSYIRCMLEEGISPADPHAKKRILLIEHVSRPGSSCRCLHFVREDARKHDMWLSCTIKSESIYAEYASIGQRGGLWCEVAKFSIGSLVSSSPHPIAGASHIATFAVAMDTSRLLQDRLVALCRFGSRSRFYR